MLRRLPRLLNAITAYELRIPQPFASKTAKRLNKSTTIILFALVKPKRLFVQIPEQMKRLYVYIRPANGAFQKRPKIFKSVRVNVPFRVALRVIDHMMDIFVRQLVVGLQRIRVNSRTFLNALSNWRVNVVTPDTFDDFAMHARRLLRRVALQKSEHGCFTDVTSSFCRSLALVHVARFCTDKCFIGLNTAFHLRSDASLHRQTNPVQHEPSGLLRYPERAVQFVRTDSVLCVGNQPESAEPFFKRDGRVLKDSPHLDRKLPFGVRVFALPQFARGQERKLCRAASRAFNNAVRPADRLHKIERVILVREVFDRVVERLWEATRFLLHAPTLQEANG